MQYVIIVGKRNSEKTTENIIISYNTMAKPIPGRDNLSLERGKLFRESNLLK